MKLYRTGWVDDEDDIDRYKHKWLGTQADCRALEKELRAQFMVSIKTHEQEVPTDKPGLLAWLNINSN